MKQYPDISELLERKARRRIYLARLPFEEKIAIVEKWRNLLAGSGDYEKSIERL